MAIDVVTEEVATNLEEIAAATRALNTRSLGWFAVGAAVGLGVGIYFGRRWQKEKLRAEAYEESKKEVELIRESYAARARVAEPKPPAEQIVEEKGYSRPLPAPVPVSEPVIVVPPPVVIYEGGRDKMEGWDYNVELPAREGRDAYIIHQDEWSENPRDYHKVTFTYYAADDVMVDEEDKRPVPHADIVVGVENLRFGHGSDDIDVVFVRNDRLEQDMEICRVPDSYEETVLGIGGPESSDDDDDE